MAESPPDRSKNPPTMAAQRLRDATDKGLTGDKVPAADPAASPLGTDDEAAGTRPPPEIATDMEVPKDQRTPSGHAKGADAFMTGDYRGRDKRNE
ncbi:hypothetical protein [Azospirillum rugosum]|uniref:Uncharacterized protein n=1 Tax=Azospirillum rugosum TaxID=416170 RepID=A0ABS4SQD2_9PROT|nr:hypothetical protein [Azospirillum rugosum]MBP2294782.1 hypothetical protein [Azospirillum rugosum]MDQ0528296.1 hypothetical protein [Azospirillum rugosum]